MARSACKNTSVGLTGRVAGRRRRSHTHMGFLSQDAGVRIEMPSTSGTSSSPTDASLGFGHLPGSEQCVGMKANLTQDWAEELLQGGISATDIDRLMTEGFPTQSCEHHLADTKVAGQADRMTGRRGRSSSNVSFGVSIVDTEKRRGNWRSRLEAVGVKFLFEAARLDKCRLSSALVGGCPPCNISEPRQPKCRTGTSTCSLES